MGRKLYYQAKVYYHTKARGFRDGLEFRFLFVKFVNFFVQQIEFSSRKIYNWMKKNIVGRKEIT